MAVGPTELGIYAWIRVISFLPIGTVCKRIRLLNRRLNECITSKEVWRLLYLRDFVEHRRISSASPPLKRRRLTRPNTPKLIRKCNPQNDISRDFLFDWPSLYRQRALREQQDFKFKNSSRELQNALLDLEVAEQIHSRPTNTDHHSSLHHQHSPTTIASHPCDANCTFAVPSKDGLPGEFVCPLTGRIIDGARVYEVRQANRTWDDRDSLSPFVAGESSDENEFN